LHQKLCKKILIKREKSTILEEKCKEPTKNTNTQSRQSYTQTSSSNIVKIKENFPNLWTKKIKEVDKVINKTRKEKPKINMISKSPS